MSDLLIKSRLGIFIKKENNNKTNTQKEEAIENIWDMSNIGVKKESISDKQKVRIKVGLLVAVGFFVIWREVGIVIQIKKENGVDIKKAVNTENRTAEKVL